MMLDFAVRRRNPRTDTKPRAGMLAERIHDGMGVRDDGTGDDTYGLDGS